MFVAPVILRTQTPDPTLQSFEVLPNTYVFGGAIPSQSARRSALGLHGTGSWQGHLLADVADAQYVLPRGRVDTWESIGERLRGSVTLYLWDRKTEEVAVLPDPLGAGIVYRFDDGSDYAASSDLRSLVDVLESRGKRLTRSAKYSACLIVTGSGGIFPSSYEEIDALDHFEYLVFSRSSISARTYRVKHRVFSGDVTYEDSLLETYEEILDNTRAAADAPHENKIAHLTGGFDSRLVLGALLKVNRQDEFKYYCLPSPQDDRDVATGLAGSYGLRMTEWSGANWSVLPGSIDEQFLGPMVRSEGILPTAPDTGMTNAGSLMLQGGYGEFYRTFHSTDMSEAVADGARSLALKMWGIRGFSFDDADSIISRDYAEEIASHLQILMDGGKQLGVRPEMIPDYLYLRVRNRYFVGTQSQAWSGIGSQFDTLYGLGSIGSTSKLDFDTRRSNVFGFDLLNMFDPNLIRYPYAKQTPFNWKYQKLRGLPSPIEFGTGEHVAFEPRPEPGATRRNGGQLVSASEEQVSRANMLRIPANRLAQSDFATPLLGPMIEEACQADPNFANVFNLSALQQKLSEPAATPADINLILTIYSSCLWLTGKDKQIWS